MDLGLKDKVAVVTGGSAGIGLAVAQALAQEGAHVALCARDEGLVQAKAGEIREQYGVQAIGVRTDVSKVEEITAFAKEVEIRFGGADILVNNAGTGSNETIMDSPDEKWQYYWDLHVMAAVRLSRCLIPSMRLRGGGVILNNASICAKQPSGYEPIYNTTKAALVMFSKCLANEVAKDNIRVNTINPGLILTQDWIKTARQLTESTDITWEQHLDKIARDSTPIGRFATPEELAHFFVFLCSDKASYCIGSEYFVDGGWLNVVA